MSTITEKRGARVSAKKLDTVPPLRLKTRAQARAYLEKHLTPIDFGPKGQPIYDLEQMQALNVIFPEDL